MRTEIKKALTNRFATKVYDETKKVSKEDFDLILETAYLSPSSFGLEPWKVLVIESKELIEQIKPYAWGAVNSFNGASHFVITLARKNVTVENAYFTEVFGNVKGAPAEYIEKVKETFHQFQKNDFRLLDNPQLVDEWASKQTYIMLGNMMYTASLLGIDSCAIEGFNKEKVKEILTEHGVDMSRFDVSYMLSFGYHKGEITPKTRRPYSDVIEVIR